MQGWLLIQPLQSCCCSSYTASVMLRQVQLVTATRSSSSSNSPQPLTHCISWSVKARPTAATPKTKQVWFMQSTTKHVMHAACRRHQLVKHHHALRSTPLTPAVRHHTHEGTPSGCLWPFSHHMVLLCPTVTSCAALLSPSLGSRWHDVAATPVCPSLSLWATPLMARLQSSSSQHHLSQF